MADNVEKFVLQFVSEDKEVVDAIKALSKSLDKVQAKVRQTAKVQANATTKLTKKEQEANAVLRKQIQLRDQITRASKMGMDTSTYERSLRAAKKATTLEKRTLQLRDEISRKRKADLGTQERVVAATKKEAAANREVARTKTTRITSSKMFAEATKFNPNRAASIEKSLENNFAAGTEQSKRNVMALRKELRLLSDQYRKAARSSNILKTSQRGLQDSTRNLLRSYVSLFAALAATNQINKTGQAFEAMDSAMLAAMGTKAEAAGQIQFLSDVTQKLGMSLLDTADQYTKFTFAAKGKMPTEEVNKFFKSVAEAGTVLGISKERMKLSFNALQQMLNKTNVQSEELKRQLAESFPGAIQIFARAIGKGEQEMFKMMEDGELLAAEIFPAVGREMAKVANVAGALEEKMKTTRVAQGRFFNQLEIAMGRTIFEAGFDRGGFDFFNQLALSLNESQSGLEGIGKTFRLVLKVLSGLIRIATPVLDSFFFVLGKTAETIEELFGSGIGKILMGLGAFTAAIRVLNTHVGKTFFMFLGILGVMDEIFSLMHKGRMGLFELSTGKDLALFSSESGFDRIARTLLVILSSVAIIIYPLMLLFRGIKGTLKMMGKAFGSKGGVSAGQKTLSGASSILPKGLAASLGKFGGPLAAASLGYDAYSGVKGLWESSDPKVIQQQMNARKNGGDTTITVPVEVINAKGMDEKELGKAIKNEISTSLPEWSRRQAVENSLGE